MRFWTGFSIAALGALVLLSGCGRDALVRGGLGDACAESLQCDAGLTCMRGVCQVPEDGSDGPDGRDPECEGLEGNVCIDGVTAGFCRDGVLEREIDCAPGACQDGACEMLSRCDEGDRRCSSDELVEECRGGIWRTAFRCNPGEYCNGGVCFEESEPGLPDYEIYFMEHSAQSSSVRLGEFIEGGLEVGNAGRVASPDVDCSVFMASLEDDSPPAWVASVGVPRLAADTVAAVYFGGFIPEETVPGLYTLVAVCDVENVVRESNENNNSYFDFTEFEVRSRGESSADLVLDFVDVESSAAGPNESSDAYAVACNFGEVGARNVSVQLYAYEEFQDSLGQNLGRIDVGTIDAGDCVEAFGRTNPVACPLLEEQFVLRAVIDANDIVDESNELNNEWFGASLNTPSCATSVCGDRFDPDDLGDPPVLGEGSYALQLCLNDVDRFRLDVEPGASVLFDLATDGSDDGAGSLEVYRVSEVGTQELAYNTYLSGSERVFFEVETEPTDEELLFVFSSQGEEGMPYNLTFRSVGEERPDLRASRTSIQQPVRPGSARTVSFAVENLGEAESSDAFESFFFLIPEGGDGIEDGIYVGGAVTNRRLGPGESLVVQSSAIVPGNLRPGEYTFAVFVDASNAVIESNENNNTATTDFFEVESGVNVGFCEGDDRFEPNGSRQDAREIEDGFFSDLRVCGGVEDGADFYRICPPPGGYIVAEASFEHRRGDVDLALFNELGARIATSQGEGDTERIDYRDVRPNACYVLSVFLFRNRPDALNDYTLSLETIDDSPGDEFCDHGEPNNNIFSSTSLDALEGSVESAFCPQGDLDFFSLELEQGEPVSFQVSPLTMSVGDISMTLYTPDQNFAQQRFAREPAIDFMPTITGRHYIRLSTTSNDALFPYVLEWDWEP